ncbi:BAR adaptor protein Hob3 [Sorochytrium milnesiophthora]
MSWYRTASSGCGEPQKGFTKAVNRGATSILQSAGAIEKTVDKEYEDEERRYRTLESKTEKLHKEAKGYLDALRAMSLAQTRMATTIDHFYDGSSPLSSVALQYKEAVEQFDNEVRGPMDSDYRAAVMDPLIRFCEFFPPFNDAIRKRNKKLLDYDSLRSKQRKLVDKPSEDPSRLPRVYALEAQDFPLYVRLANNTWQAEQDVMAARQTYETVNSSLRREMPMLVDLRVPYLDPSFEALLKIQYNYCMHAEKHLEDLQRKMAVAGVAATDLTAADRSLEGVVDNVLSSMRELSICGPLAASTSVSGMPPSSSMTMTSSGSAATGGPGGYPPN